MQRFRIHQQLLADSHYLGKLAVCHLLLNRNALIPWFILVPEVAVTDLLDVPADQRNKIMDECARISRWIKQHYGISRINFGAIGNIVPQLHLHVIGRAETDICWPKPVWGHLDTVKKYAAHEVESIRQQLNTEFLLAADADPGC